jgi:hypothetical protein
LVEKAVDQPHDDVAALAYDAGIGRNLAARIVALERAMENPLLLGTVTDLANAYGELVREVADLRESIAALQLKKK